MKIALVGYGNMGPMVHTILREQQKHDVVSISYKDGRTLDIDGIMKADVAIDFSNSEVVIRNIQTIAKLKINIVVGTTGWYQHLPLVKKIVTKEKIGFVYASNFSIGAHIFFSIVQHASKQFSKYGSYDVYGFEIHHTGKKDSPSGTAQKIGDVILKNFPRKKRVQEEKLDRQIKDDELHIASVRGGYNPGRHEVVFDSLSDEVKLVHQAHNRRGFAEGAIMAAEFIKGKKGFYTFDMLFART